MAIRVTQGLMYNSFVSQMNTNLSNLMESNIQSSSQKKVNRPSDDPFSSGRILSTRATLNTISVYKENINTAMGWLSSADGILGSGNGSVQTVLSRLQELAEQGASGSYDKLNREQMSSEIRELYKELISLANYKFDNHYIFGGQKTDKAPYVEGLAADCYDQDADNSNSIANAEMHVEGASSSTVLIQAIATDPAGSTSGPAGTATYRYSSDGGNTWHDAVVTNDDPKAGQCTITAGGVRVQISDSSKNVSVVDTTADERTDNGTWIYVRPTAIYQGDESSNKVVASYGTSVSGEAEGHFTRNVSVRVDSVEGGQVNYSYSVDNGSNWIQAKAPEGTPLAVPGGYLELDGIPKAGDQFQIQPHLSDISFQISDSDSITVNMIGKDIFGGLYDYPQDGNDRPVPVTGQANLFEVVGKLVAAAETGSQSDMSQAVKDLKDVMQVVMTRAAEVGGRENRLEITYGSLVIRQYSEEDNLSQMEDVDLSELMTRLSQQQIAYNSVLKSSSMIMQMSLVNFL